MGQKKVSFIESAKVVLGVGKGVLFREVSSVQGCPYRGVPLCIHVCVILPSSVATERRMKRRTSLGSFLSSCS